MTLQFHTISNLVVDGFFLIIRKIEENMYNLYTNNNTISHRHNIFLTRQDGSAGIIH